MTRIAATVIASLAISVASVLTSAFAQSPAAGYYDIPPGFDFPANKLTLEEFRKTGNLKAQRLHAWNVFGGLTHLTPDGQRPIFETWYSESDAFADDAVAAGVGPRRLERRFRVPRQFEPGPGQLAAGPGPSAAPLLSEVIFNFANYNHIRTKSLYLTSELKKLQQAGAADPKIPNNKTIPAFPAEAISLKTVWWPVAKDIPTAMPIWDPESNQAIPNGNDYSTWKRVIAIDPARTNVPANETMTIKFLNVARPASHVVGLDKFYYVKLDRETAANAMANSRLATFVGDVLGRPLAEGDFVVFAGTHVTTKEIDDWVWATFWWHDRPDSGSFAAERPASVEGVWRNYLMSTSYDLLLPREKNGTAHVTFNPFLEAHFPNGVVSNCMNCHNRAAFAPVNFLPIHRGNPDLQTDPAYAKGKLRTDFLWSIPFNAH